MKQIVKIWYSKPEYGCELMMGDKWLRDKGIVLSPATLEHTHVLLKTLEASEVNLEALYYQFQAEQWSPKGEARELISSKGLAHTSMSVGDVIQVDDKCFLVDLIGFRELTDNGGINETTAR